MKQYPSRKLVRLLGTVLLLLALSASAPLPAAEANYFSDLYDGLQQFSELPGEVNELQESYKQTVEELEKTKDQLSQTVEDMESYRTQNAALQEQNRQLAQVVDELREDRAARESYIHRIKITIFTGAGLIIGYFILVRLIRLGMRRRSKQGDRIR
jgi:DNA repair exonuclease SbcCD ATPase subunit